MVVIPSQAVERSSVDWLIARRDADTSRGFSFFAPPIFDRYFRILHPLQLPTLRGVDGASWRDADGFRDVTWKEIAEALGAQFTATTTIASMRAVRQFPEYENLVQYGESEPSQELINRLGEVLCPVSEELLSFVGYDGAWASHVPEFAESSSYRFRNATYYFAEVENSAVLDEVEQFPTYWWPNTRAWIVVSPLDVHWSLVGCGAMAADKLQRSKIEMFEIDPHEELPVFDSLSG